MEINQPKDDLPKKDPRQTNVASTPKEVAVQPMPNPANLGLKPIIVPVDVEAIKEAAKGLKTVVGTVLTDDEKKNHSAKNREAPAFTFPICPYESALMDLWVKYYFEDIRKNERQLAAYELLKLKNPSLSERQISKSIIEELVNDAIEQPKIATSRFFKLSKINRNIFGVPDTPFVMVDNKGNVVDQALPHHEITKLKQLPICPLNMLVAYQQYPPV